jgi:hypothetical protein
MTPAAAVSNHPDWKYFRDLGRLFEHEAGCATEAPQKSRYYRLAGNSYRRSAALAQYDLQDIMVSDAARCYDAAAPRCVQVAG